MCSFVRELPALIFSQCLTFIIASPEEIRAKKASQETKFKVDLSYLTAGSSKSLASKLAHRQFEDAAEMQTTKAPAVDTVLKPSRPAPTPEEIKANIEKRRQSRLQRRAEEVAPVLNEIKNIRPIAQRLASMRSESNDNNTTASPTEALYEQPALDAEAATLASESAAKRKVLRLRREKELGVQVQGRQQTKNKKNKKKEAVTVQVEEVEGAGQPGGHEPQFKGPEDISNTLMDVLGNSFSAKDVKLVASSGQTVALPLSRILPFKSGDYSLYTSLPSSDPALPPDVLGPVDLAKQTLSHQQHWDLSQRKRAVELITQSTPATSEQIATSVS